ncbi:hypothetical protein HU200_051474 [Digitaria exilis]|uniref:Gnk2-homologous domain-containing protein n=1 Tax=Digitaria exilis TaxID=1010633 RepID=A0A835AKK2_9POAL|nr:hypothetical protein HU200_051474 [Digitaria exilis]
MVRLTVMATAGTSPNVECVGDGIYTANSTYEANRRRLAAVLLAEARDHPYYTERAVGHWPNRLEASFFCRSGDSSCAACIADAFLEVDRECPYHREASFSSRNCTLELEEYRILGTGGIHGEFCHASFNLQKLNLSSFSICNSFTCIVSRTISLAYPLMCLRSLCIAFQKETF